MTTALITHAACLEHDPGPYHPECPDRLRAVLKALDAPEFAALVREEAPQATKEQLVRVHPARIIDAILAIRPEDGDTVNIDADTVMSMGSAEAALRAAGGAVHAVDMVMTGQVLTAFAAVRPPGHHAEPSRPMGFCLFNNAAVAAQHARAVHKAGRVAVLDFDVHHGNGTQALFSEIPELFYASTHQAPFYPGTGDAWERGIANNVVNMPLRAREGSDAFRHAWTSTIIPELNSFRPDLLIISAGFDAHREDPLASIRLENDDYAWITDALLEVARTHCGGRVVSVLEGGYDLETLSICSAIHVRGLMAQTTAAD
jgi:acetoin utilization deacetylase AcuC-like enzyme